MDTSEDAKIEPPVGWITLNDRVSVANCKQDELIGELEYKLRCIEETI